MLKICFVPLRRLTRSKYRYNNAFTKDNCFAISRSFAVSSSIIETNVISRLNGTRGFSRRTSSKLKLSKDNILSSPFSDINISSKDLYHEYIYATVDKWPDRIAMECSETGRSYTYSQLRKMGSQLATSLRKNKLYPGSTIAIILPNIPEYAIVVLGASEAGLKVTLINPAYTVDEIKRQLKNSEASAVFTVPSKYSAVKMCIENNPKITIPIIVINDGSAPVPSDSIRFDDLTSDHVEEFSKSEKSGIDNNATAILPYSSGTTNLPKGVELTHRNVVTNLRQLQHKEVHPGIETTKTHQDVVPLFLPLFHAYAFTICMSNYLRTGAKLVCMPKFTTTKFLKLLEDYRPMLLHATPPVLQFLANSDRITKRHLENIRYTMCAAAPLGLKWISKFRERTNPKMTMVQGYGLTETSPIITASCDDTCDPTSSGYPLSHTELRIVGQEEHNLGKNLGIGEVGEIYVRGPQVMKGYYKNPEATANIMDGEWLKTGDLGFYDEKGLLFVKDRIKEIMKVKGYQVAPAELEALIITNSKIKDVAVIGVEHEKYGEIPKAFVVPKTGIEISKDEIKNFVAQRVVQYKHLGHVEFIDQIPRNPSGKILRKDLRNL